MDVSRGHMFEPYPEAWSLERLATGDLALRIGARRVPVSDIRGVSREDVAERDDLGIVTTGILFVLMATIFTIGVIEAGWPERYLIGAGFLGIFGAVSLVEGWFTPTIRYVRLKIETTGGERLFTTADLETAAALEACLPARR